MIKAVLFDIDGTLVNSLGHYLSAYREVLLHYGLAFSDKEIAERCFGKTEESICLGLGIPEKAAEFRKMYFAWVKRNIPNLRLFPDTIKTLEDLRKRQIKIGLITFAYDWYLKSVVKQFELDKYVQVKIGFNDVTNAKPDSEAVIKAGKSLGVSENEILVVGDSKSDILMGKNAGSQTVLYTPLENKRFYDFEEVIKAVNPDFIITALGEITDFLS